MAAAANHSHRAGKLKQQNKRNKRATASKRSVSRKQGGKIQASSLGGPRRGGVKANNDIIQRSTAKANRLNAAKQRRDNSRKNVWNARRGLATATTAADGVHSVANILSRALSNNPPRIIGIISLSEDESNLEELVRQSLLSGADHKVLLTTSTSSTTGSSSASASVTTSYSAHAKGTGQSSHYLTLLTNSASFRSQYSDSGYEEDDASVQGSLDLCRVCDLVLFLIDGSTVVSSSTVVATGMNLSDAHSIANTSIKTSNTTAHLDHLISDRGDRILTAIRGQGLPTPVTVIVHRDMNMAMANNDTEGCSPLGRNIGGGGEDDEDVMHDDNDSEADEDEMEDGIASLTGAATHTTHRSMKSIKRSYLRKRSELKRYISRVAVTEFGHDGNKVVELDISSSDNITDNNNKMEEETEESVTATTSTAMSTATAVTKKSPQQTSIAALVRMLCTISASGPNWVADAARPYLVTDGSIADDAAAASSSTTTSSSSSKVVNVPPVQYNESTQELQLTGYIRGNTPWNANQLVHVPHLGTFAVKDIKLAGVNVGNTNTANARKELLPPIVAAGRKVRKTLKSTGDKDMDDVDASANNKISNDDGVGMTLAEFDPEERESLDMFASPDALEGEQNLIGFDDGNNGGGIINEEDDDDQLLADGGGGDKAKLDQFQPGTARPTGWSDYQSAWLDALDPNNEEDDADRGELAFALNKKSSDNTVMGDNDDDADVNAEEKRALLAQRKKDAHGDLQFPDEVDHEEETSARDRYARYRAIKSFRKSYWDPKENLPDSYGAVYHFSSFKATQRDVLEDVKEVEHIVQRRGWGVMVGDAAQGKSGGGDDVDMEQDSEDEEEEAMARACVPPGAYVTITLENVPASAYAKLSPSTLLTAVSLLPHENKVSVLHMGITTSSKSEHDEEIPVKSKDVLTFRCGWRTWQSRPIFSQHNLNSDKHKFERYMPTGGGTYFAASVFGPVTYGTCPVMMFRETNGGSAEDIGCGKKREFLAHGSMLGADADRIVLKRIILTGYPTRVHKRHATVKYMFYNPEDVRWFMPAGITTKHGLQGNIIQSVGVHGVMKCLFNAPIKQHDTVCLPLYKRVFPKLAPVENGDVGEGGKQHFIVL